jgi:hypothetical protein
MRGNRATHRFASELLDRTQGSRAKDRAQKKEARNASLEVAL